MTDKKYTKNQAIEIANLGVELGQERVHIKRFGYESNNARSFALRIGPYMDVFEPVLRAIPIKERRMLPIKMRDFSGLAQPKKETLPSKLSQTTNPKDGFRDEHGLIR